jgi:hypothetical protein
MVELDDVSVLRDWWSVLKPKVPAGIAGIWFGIADLAFDGQQPRRTIYVAGCSEFDPADPSAEWAVGPYAWWPDGRYVSPPGLAHLPGENYTAVLEHAAAILSAIGPHEGLDVDGVAVGFDDGDFLIIWKREHR